jgi:hypothetical protein
VAYVVSAQSQSFFWLPGLGPFQDSMRNPDDERLENIVSRSVPQHTGTGQSKLGGSSNHLRCQTSGLASFPHSGYLGVLEPPGSP